MDAKATEISEKGERFLRALHEATRGDRSLTVSVSDLGRRLGYSQEETDMAVQYLEKGKLLDFIVMGGEVAITEIGVAKIRESQTNLREIAKLTRVIARGLPRLKMSREDLKEARAEIRTIAVQASSPRPKFSIIFGSLKTLRSILLKMTQNLTARDLVKKIDRVK